MALSKLLSAGFARTWVNFWAPKIPSDFSPWWRDKCLQWNWSWILLVVFRKKIPVPTYLGVKRMGLSKNNASTKQFSYGSSRHLCWALPAGKQLSRKGPRHSQAGVTQPYWGRSNELSPGPPQVSSRCQHRTAQLPPQPAWDTGCCGSLLRHHVEGQASLLPSLLDLFF